MDALSRGGRVPFALALILLAAAAPCAAKPAWSEPETISEPGLAFSPRVAMDAVGNTLAAWVEREPDGRYVSAYRWWRPGSGWGPVRQVPRARGGIEDLEITPHGEASVLVLRNSPDYLAPVAVAVGTARPGEAIGDFQTVTEDAATGFSARFGLDDAGGAIVAWRSWADPYKTHGPEPSFVATRPPGGEFGPPQHVGDSGNGPQAADINAAGAAAVAWAENDGAKVTYRPPGGSFGPPEPSGLYGPTIALALNVGGGLAVTSAIPYLNPGPESRARYATRSPLGEWSGPRVLDADGIVTDLFFDPLGALTFLIAHRPANSNESTARVITLRPDGSLDDAPLSSGPTRSGPAGAMNLRGDILAAWERPHGDGDATEVVARDRTFGAGAFGPELVLANSYRGSVETALNDLGQAVVAWWESNPDGEARGAIRAAVRDDPTLREIPQPPDADIYSDPLASLDGDGDLLAPVRCSQRCKVTATGIVFPGGEAQPMAGSSKSKRLAARRRTRIKLDFGTEGAKAVHDALAAGGRPWVSVSVRARGKSPRPFIISRRFKIKR
jgi:hypothetical protein